MKINKIHIVNYKNHSELQLEFNPKINCFVGQNAVGKTNILDAIYYLSFTKSFSSYNDIYNIKHEESYFMLKGEYTRKDSDEELICSLKEGEKKIFKRNKSTYKQLSEHIGNFPLVIISPADSELILGGSESRRKFMDGVLSQYDKTYLQNLLHYNNLLKHRNSLLKQGNFSKQTIEVIETLDLQLVHYGEPIYQSRKIFTDEFIRTFQSIYKDLSNDSQSISIEYESVLHHQSFSELLSSNYQKDRIVQYTTNGIHKDDLNLNLAHAPLKKIGSQGQQKTFLLALKLAQYQHLYTKSGIKPILLLDDIFDKLDMNRVQNLIKLITDREFGQTFITDTHEGRLREALHLDQLDYKVFNISL